jgi:hypothetical protein
LGKGCQHDWRGIIAIVDFIRIKHVESIDAANVEPAVPAFCIGILVEFNALDAVFGRVIANTLVTGLY